MLRCGSGFPALHAFTPRLVVQSHRVSLAARLNSPATNALPLVELRHLTRPPPWRSASTATNTRTEQATPLGNYGSPVSTYRTHTCGELGLQQANQQVALCGWVQYVRKATDQLLFIGLRDKYGVVQLVASADCPALASKFTQLQALARESVIHIQGTVAQRPKDMVNKAMSTGEIEVNINSVCIFNAAHDLPFLPQDTKDLPKEEVRLRHRHLDLRRPLLQENMRKRSNVCHTIRKHLIEQEQFTEIETPILFKSTPEGAREYLVPTRTKDRFFALPQSPQQFKQLLMVSGIDRYFQIARCFRDEDLRADRQPEFSQVDIEMSFVHSQDVIRLIEALISQVWQTTLGIDIQDHGGFGQLAYADAIAKYGSDKPDLRFDMPIRPLSDLLSSEIDSKATTVIEYLVVPEQSQFTRKLMDEVKGAVRRSELNHESITNSIYRVSEQGLKCISSFSLLDRHEMGTALVPNLLSTVLPGSTVVISQRSTSDNPAFTTLGRVRLVAAELLQRKGLLTIDANSYKFTWIHSFPLFTPELDAHGQVVRMASTHHPFTAPFDEDIPLLEQSPGKVRAKHYDLVLNGMEIAGGSIRIHATELQQYIFDQVLQLPRAQRARFDHLLAAFKHGCPPHGGIAIGLDRLMAILCGAPTIRDVIAFPKSSSGYDLLMNSPSAATNEQLNTYHIRLAD
ncbi:aspartate--tRNA ligase msd1 [Dimargaris xerosporica]|nr:aspartate--tRNA ligase msd1 [Dimargaris xerosporica]